MKLTGACIFGQSGGPTSVINSSAYGVIRAALDAPEITKVYCAANGVKGILEDRLYDMGVESADELALLQHTPSSIFGSCRYKLKDFTVDDTDYKRILEIFKKYDVRYFFYNGGNDSMDTCDKVSRYMESVGYECCIIGVPKTIDNDLYGIDHCPGFASAARFISTSVAEIYLDAHVYDTGMVTIIEAMGRNAGWLTASAALARHAGTPVDLIYMPERPFDVKECMDAIEKIYAQKKSCLVVVSEGIMDKDGKFIAEYASDAASATDSFGHKQMGGVASYLAAEAKARIGCKTRGIELSLLQRCAAHCASKVDIDEAVMLGKKAVEIAVSGITGKMVAIVRKEGTTEYIPEIKLFPLTSVANAEHKFPEEWILDDVHGISEEFDAYALPLIDGDIDYPREKGLPRFARLKLELVK